MAKASAHFVCQACGTVHPRWSGKCEACGEWNSIVEEAGADGAPKGLGRGKGSKLAFESLSGDAEDAPRMMTAIGELDRVLGGGLVHGSAVLIGGDPGIGKSTILLQAAVALANSGAGVAYISGEESVAQVRLRANRLGLAKDNVQLAAATSVRDILASLEVPLATQKPPLPLREGVGGGGDAGKDHKPAHPPTPALPRKGGGGISVVIIDSIQTMYLDSLDSAPGTVAQVRGSAHELIRFAKKRGIALFLVGHVTKEGQIAGPRVLEHMVDTVLYFEGERGHPFRILRAIKNRFGGTDEIGVFEMGELGLAEVANPSELFLSERNERASGSAVYAGLEGSRPVLMEIQALIAPSPMATPRRAVVGWDSARLAMVLAVLEARAGIFMGDKEVYLNVAGGLRITEPAADLAVAAALLSALTDSPVPSESVFFGEIGLSGEIRSVGRSDARLKEAEKLGFKNAYLAPQKQARAGLGMTVLPHVQALAALFGIEPGRAPQRRTKEHANG